MNGLENIFLSICVFGSAVFVIFILAKYNYLIKKALAEKGIETSKSKVRYIEIGCIVLGIGIGLGISSVFTLMNLPEDTTDLLIYATIMVCGGLGLIAAHVIRRKFERE